MAKFEETPNLSSWRITNLGRFFRVCWPASNAALPRLVLVALAVLALAAGWRWSERGAAVPTYETRPIGFGVVERSISATGSVKALVTVDVGSQLSGMIAEMKADFNNRVKEGALLAVIDRAPFEAKLASATANFAMARADIGLREAAVARARIRVAQDERDAARFEVLSPKGVVSQKSREDAQTQLGLARADLAMAIAQLESAKAAVAQREADVSQAQIDLDHTLIRSPINGIVVDRRMQPGQTVAAQYQTPILFQIAQDLSQILIFAQVDEADIGPVRPGAPVTFTVEAYPDEKFEGKVDQVRLAATKVGGRRHLHGDHQGAKSQPAAVSGHDSDGANHRRPTRERAQRAQRCIAVPASRGRWRQRGWRCGVGTCTKRNT